MQETSIKDIDVNCEEFRISETLDSPAVVESLRELGQLNPVVLLDRIPRLIVCGFRRIRALQQLGRTQVLAHLFPESAGNALHPFELALRENLSHRQLDPLEKARAIDKLQSLCRMSRDRLLQVYFPLLGLAPHETVLAGYAALHAVHPLLRRCLLEGSLTLSSVEVLARRSHQEQSRFASLMSAVRLSASLQKKVLGLLEDLSGMSDVPLDEPLQDAEIRSMLEDARLSPFQKGDRLHAILYRARNPRLSSARERFQEKRDRLDLPGSIRIIPHPFFETNDIRVEFDAPDAGRFRELAAALQQAAQRQELEGLFQLKD